MAMNEQNRFGSVDTGALLAELRRRAGFSSASAAAAAFGWSASTLSAHESGRRRIAPLDAERYGSAFNCESAAFQDASRAAAELERLRRERAASASTVREPSRLDVGRRLTFARRVRGFKKRSSACAAFGFPRPTLTAHELGSSAIPDAQGRLYAKAYGVSLDWLTNGVLPSGLGAAVDRRLRSDPNPSEETADEMAHVADRYVAPDRAGLGVPKAFAHEGSTGLIREVVSDYESENGISEIEGAPRFWSLPEDYDLQLLGARAENIVVLPNGRGGRFFVDALDRNVGNRGSFLYVDGNSRPVIVPQASVRGATTGKRLVGRLLAEINVYRRG